MHNKTNTTDFSELLQSRKILIADPSPMARSVIYKSFCSLGANSKQIFIANTLKQATEYIIEAKPQIIVSEYQIEHKSGLLLIQEQRQQMSRELKDCLFVVVTNNTSQAAVAAAVEEDVDGFILKPFTRDGFRSALLKAATNKFNPNTYQCTIEEGKKYFDDSRYEEAEKIFEQAMTLDKRPCRAYYYYGQCRNYLKDYEGAKKAYQNGLKLNKIHCLCLSGMFELLMAQNETHQAYEFAKKILQYYPASPRYLSEVLRLAVANRKLDDIERYYSLFCKVEEKDERLIRYICAALVVCGKYYLGTRMKTRAFDLFKKAALTSNNQASILREITQALINFRLGKDAASYLNQFSESAKQSQEFKVLRFQVANLEQDPKFTIDDGKALVEQDIHHEAIYAILIHRLAEKKDPQASLFLSQAIQKFSEKREYFEKLFRDPDSFWKTGGG